MSWWETVRLALDAIIAHRVRSALTTLGIMIGIAAVTLSVGLAQGAAASVNEQIDSLGSNLLTIVSGGMAPPGATSMADMQPLTMADAAALADREVAPDLAGVAPVTQNSLEFAAGDKVVQTTIEATTAEWAVVRARNVQSGQFLTPEQVTDAEAVVVLGSSTARSLFGDQAVAVGQAVSVGGTTLRVVGVLASTGSAGGMMSGDDLAVVPLSTYQDRLARGEEPLSAIYVQAAPDRMTQAYQEAQALLLARRNAASPEGAGFMILSQQSLAEAMAAITTTLTLLLGGIAAISLVVGGIGVMNIMLVSVSERFREIGLRKALGARRRTILMQFLTEAATLALVGGAFGLAFSAGVAWLITTLAKFPVPVSLPTVLMALGVSASIGIIAGVYPAARAARLAPIDALRRE